MSFRDSLRRVRLSDGRELIGASFRGISFLVESVERSGGRRAVVHEFPLRDDPFVEDMGRKARSFRVEGYVLGDSYLADRDNLLDAIERNGVGQLQLPYYDLKRAFCTSYSVRETKTEGGMAIFSLEFAEAPNQVPVPTAAVDAPAQVAVKADEAVTATKAELEKKYNIIGLPSFALGSAEKALASATKALGAALAPIIRGKQELADLTGRLALITAQTSSLVRTPVKVLTAFGAAIAGLGDTIEAAPRDVMNALVESYGFIAGGEVLPATATRKREIANQTALVSALRRMLAIEAARFLALAEFVSIQDAIDVRDQVTDALDQQAGLADDVAYPAIVALRSEVMRAVPGGRVLASIVTHAQNAPIPSIVLAHRLYGSTSKAADIVSRNDVAHPGFCFGTLKVLSDD